MWHLHIQEQFTSWPFLRFFHEIAVETVMLGSSYLEKTSWRQKDLQPALLTLVKGVLNSFWFLARFHSSLLQSLHKAVHIELLPRVYEGDTESYVKSTILYKLSGILLSYRKLLLVTPDNHGTIWMVTIQHLEFLGERIMLNPLNGYHSCE